MTGLFHNPFSSAESSAGDQYLDLSACAAAIMCLRKRPGGPTADKVHDDTDRQAPHRETCIADHCLAGENTRYSRTRFSLRQDGREQMRQYLSTTDVNNKPRVFRLRNLRAPVNRRSTVELLCDAIESLMAQYVPRSSPTYDVYG